MRATRILLTLLLLATTLSACAYSLRPGRLREGLEVVAVPYLENRSREPDVEIELTEAIIDGLVRDRTLRVADESRADAIVLGTIRQYNFREVFFGGDRQAEEYEITIAVEVEVIDRATRESIVGPKTITGKGSYLLEVADGEEAAREEAVGEIIEGILNLVLEEW